MRLSELGELGLLDELERRRLARRIGAAAARRGGSSQPPPAHAAPAAGVFSGPAAGGAARWPPPPGRPPLRRGRGRRLARGASAMIAVPDGLAPDAAHVARRSGCRVT